MQNLFKMVQQLLKKRQRRVSFNQQFDRAFFEEKYFLNPKANLDFMAAVLKCHAEKIESYCLRKYNMDFMELCDRNRVKMFLQNIDNPDTGNHTIGSIIKESGFLNAEELEKSLRKYNKS